jgi:hypothetical protein
MLRPGRVTVAIVAMTSLLVTTAPGVHAALPAGTAAPAHVSLPTRDARDDGIITGLTVPWAIGGERIERNGERGWFPGEWPTIPFDSIRLWDTRTAWLNIEPADDQWDFRRLDAFVAKAEARGVRDISLVLAGTPQWAAAQRRPTDAPWLGPGSASPARDIAEWTEFVATVAERYRGRITSYEILNEPNDVVFWSGTRRQWAQHVRTAVAAIRQVDPEVTLVASGFAVRRPQDVPALARWTDLLRGTDLDALSVHWYPRAGTDLRLTRDVAAAAGRLAQAAGVPASIWITETNVRGGIALSPAAQRAAVDTMTASAAAGGAARMTWYAWTDLTRPDLLLLYPGTPAARALAAQAA